jgi:hypothetical protein
MNGRRIVIAFLVLGAAFTAVVLWLGGNLDALVKGAVERYGGRMTGTEVRLAGVDLELREGRGTLTGLRVANPEGFSGGDAVTLGEITLDVDTESLAREPIVIEEIRVSGPHLLVELAKDGSVNLRALQESVEDYVPAAQADGGGGGSPPPRVAVRKLTVEGGRIVADATAVGGERSERDLGAFTLTDLGGASGVPADELGREVLRALLRRSVEQGAMDALKQKAGDTLKDAAGGLLKDLGG